MTKGRHELRRPRGVRAARIAIALALVVLSCVVGLGGTSGNRAEAATSSSVTKSGSGEFAGVKVTVSQTKNLVNQVVNVTWTGGTPTLPAFAGFWTNYMQIMECWGDDPSGPSPTQCQYGASAGSAGDSGAESIVGTRQLTSSGHVDPLETMTNPSPGCPGVNVNLPFKSVTGKTSTCGTSEFFDQNTTNEIPVARTRGDGTGKEYFEVQTATEAPGLGCGTRQNVGGKVSGRGCWLVVVPRGDHEIDGTTVSGANAQNRLASSPLSTTNWKQRIQFPLGFQPIGSSCALGSAETPTVGHEVVTEAMSRWQSALCTRDTVVGFSQVSVDAARRQLLSNAPGLDFMSYPVDPDQAAGKSLSYAPVALSGVAIAFDVEKHYEPDASDSLLKQQGQRFANMNLTPRLVAKLLTQSYRAGVDPSAAYLKSNPSDLTRDPEFKKYNPEWNDHLSSNVVLPDVLTPFGQSDAARVLWTWVMSDKSARAFINGTADPWGMKINPHYKKIALPVEEFPKNDLFCKAATAVAPPLCTLDAHPYAADMHDAARSASRGDTQRRNNYDIGNASNPAGWKKEGLQSIGQRQVVSLTDTATAARFGLPTAHLMNASGKFAAPTTASMLAAYKGMKADPKVKGVLDANPAASSASAYPLTMLTYGGTDPAALSKADRGRYAAVLRYAAGPGQTPGIEPGQLPDGYAPLPATLRTQTKKAATALVNWKAPAAATTDGGSDGTGPSATSGGSGSSSTTSTTADGTSTTATTPPPGAAGSPTVVTLAAATKPTPGFATGLARFLVPVALLIGVLAAAAGPALLVGSRSLRKAVPQA